MPECKMYRFDSQGYYQGEDTTYSDKDIDFVRDYRPPAMHTWTPPPKYDPATEIPQYAKGEWRIVILASLEPTLEEVKERKLAELAEARWMAETGGLTLPDGTVIKTDRESQALLTGAAFSLYADPTSTVEWKADKGKWVDLDSKQVLLIAGAVRAHVQGCFSRERDLSEKVNACVNVAEVASIVWQ